MLGRYELEANAGTVNVTKEGLYYRFSCRCNPPGGGLQRLVVTTDAGRVDLGICVPMDGCFGVEKRLPCKQFGSSPEFQLIGGHGGGGRFVPVYPEEPFAYIRRLKDAFLEVRGGQVGIVIAE